MCPDRRISIPSSKSARWMRQEAPGAHLYTNYVKARQGSSSPEHLKEKGRLERRPWQDRWSTASEEHRCAIRTKGGASVPEFRGWAGRQTVTDAGRARSTTMAAGPRREGEQRWSDLAGAVLQWCRRGGWQRYKQNREGERIGCFFFVWFDV
jgi:hypothetical protein